MTPRRAVRLRQPTAVVRAVDSCLLPAADSALAHWLSQRMVHLRSMPVPPGRNPPGASAVPPHPLY